VFLLPFEKTIEVDLREQILPLDRRTYSTGDGKQVRIFGSMRWQITDPVRSVTLLETTFGTIQVFVEKWLDVAVTTFSAVDVDEHSKDLQNKLLASLQKELPAWGSDLLACEIVGIRQDR
jgi:regulator of protease activity HflC (stomatin/prohibitin superfamily)